MNLNDTKVIDSVKLTINNPHNVEIPEYVIRNMKKTAMFQGRYTFTINLAQPEMKSRWDNLNGTGILVSQFNVNGKLYTAKTSY